MRPWPGLWVAVACALLLAACGGATSNAEGLNGRTYRHTVSGSEVGGDAPPSTAPPTTMPYTVDYHGSACPFDPDSANHLKIDCGTLAVPMRRDQPQGNKVWLSVAVIRSQSKTPAPDPIIDLEGGPGGSALASVDRWTRPVSPLLSNRDVILVDQRGTGYSQPRLTCEQMFATDQPVSETDDIKPQVTECAQRLKADHIDLAAFNSEESAADIADLRKALKIDKWNIYGVSYGTRLALEIMQHQPEGIRSVVLDSVYPPSVKGLEEQPANLYRALQALFADCQSTPTCNGPHPNLEQKLSNAIDNLNRHPLTARGYDRVTGEFVTQKIDGKVLVFALFDAMYRSSVIPDVPKAIDAAAAGDLETAFELLAGLGAQRRKPVKPGDRPPPSADERPHRSDGLFLSVDCAEEVPEDTVDGLNATSEPINPLLRDPLVTNVQRELDECSAWGVPDRRLTEVHSDVPTLVMSGTYDPITPAAWGQRAAANLPNSQFVSITGAGHGMIVAGDCPLSLIKQFFDDPTAPSPGCPADLPAFTP